MYIAPSISAIFGFTFLLGRMTEVLTPDIYGAHWWELPIIWPPSIQTGEDIPPEHFAGIFLAYANFKGLLS